MPLRHLKDNSAEQTKFYKNHYPFVFKYIRNFLAINNSYEDSQEIAQDTFLRSFKNPQKYNPHRGTTKQWLTLLARKASEKYYRKNTDALTARRVDLISIEHNKWLQDLPEFLINESAIDKMLLYERAQRLYQHMTKLPDVQLKAIYLAKIEGWTRKEIAREIGRTETAVWSLVHKGMKKLANSLLSDAYFHVSSEMLGQRRKGLTHEKVSDRWTEDCKRRMTATVDDFERFVNSN